MSLRQAPLTQKNSEVRFSHFADEPNLVYHLYLRFDRGDTYGGRLTATFDLKKVSEEFFIDYSGTDVTQLTINGTTLEDPESHRADRFINLKKDLLKEGSNEITVGFKNKFATNGQGLHGFIDTDGKQYFYSELEPYYCNKFFPTFDQPDLKAPLFLTTAAPKEWLVVANNPVDEEKTSSANLSDFITKEEEATHKVQVYQKVPKVSSYLYCVCGGDYKEIKNEDPDCAIQMSIFCRESLVKFLGDQAKEIFLVHKESIRFYEEFFGVKYPFGKCDALFAVEYNMGAMENPGLILYNDRFIWKDKVTRDMNSQRVNVIAHEVSHQWFGNLVTMKWWNDLWLNESFAEFISHYCQSQIFDTLVSKNVELVETWAIFHLRKERGYVEDQQISTHAIAGDVKDTDQAKSIFDGITYNKGASTIRQLMALIGAQNFGKAIGNYFTKYAWGNTTLADFLGALQEYYKPTHPNSPKDLTEWGHEWLETAGLNTADPTWNENDTSSTAKITIKQGYVLEDHPTLRHHLIKIAFFNNEGVIYEVKEVMLNNTQETVVEYDGSKKPAAILLNYRDEAFIKVGLDLTSLNFFKENLTKISEEMTRILIWRAFYDLARDGHWSIYQFTHMASHSFHHESSTIVVKLVLSFVNTLLELVPGVLKKNYCLPELFHGVEKALGKTDKSDTGRLVLLRDHLIMYASLGELSKVDNVIKIIDWLKGENNDLADHPLSLANKWSIVVKAHIYPKLSETSQKALFDKVAALDQSDEMKRVEKKCEALRANSKDRQKIFASFLDPEDKTSLHTVAEVMRGYASSQRYSHEDEVKFFDHMIEVYEKKDFFIGRAYVSELFPSGDNVKYYLERLLEVKAKAEHQMLKKQIGNHLDTLRRKQKCYLVAAPDLLKLTYHIDI